MDQRTDCENCAGLEEEAGQLLDTIAELEDRLRAVAALGRLDKAEIGQ